MINRFDMRKKKSQRGTSYCNKSKNLIKVSMMTGDMKVVIGHDVRPKREADLIV